MLLFHSVLSILKSTSTTVLHSSYREYQIYAYNSDQYKDDYNLIKQRLDAIARGDVEALDRLESKYYEGKKPETVSWEDPMKKGIDRLKNGTHGFTTAFCPARPCV